MRPLLLLAAMLPGLALAQIEAQPGRDEAERAAEEPPPPPVLTKAPELLTFVDAVYPEAAKEEGPEGEVVVMLTLDAEGKVSEAVVTQSFDPRFDEPALTAAKQLLFSPAEVNDVPSPIQMEFRYVFTYRPPPPPPEEEVVEAPPPVNFVGQVLVRGRRTPIESAFVVSGDFSTQTDGDGRFELAMPIGEHAISIKAPGFDTFETNETFAEGERTEGTYYLLRTARSPYETVVRAPKPKKEVTRVTLERAELTRVPGTFGDPIRVIENLPGMARAPFIGGQLLVRGANPEDTGVYFDGVGIPLLYHFGGLTSVVNPEFLEEIDFLPGGFGAEYGRATAGIVSVTSRESTGELARGAVKVDFTDTSVFYRTPLTEGLSLAVAGRRSYIDVLLPPIIAAANPTSQRITLAPVYQDYQLKLDWDLGRDHHLGLFAFGSSDTFKVFTPSEDRSAGFEFKLLIAFHRLLLTHRWRISPTLTLYTRPFIGTTIQKAGGGEVEGDLAFSVRLARWEAGGRQHLEWKPDPVFTARLGIDLYALRANSTVEAPLGFDVLSFPAPEQAVPTTREFEINSGGSGSGLWGEVVFQPHESFTLTPGLRVELYDFAGVLHPTLDPRLAARWEALEGTVFKGAFGLYHQAPDVLEINELTGNPEVLPEGGQHHVLGVEQKITDVIDVDLELFYNLRPNSVVGSPDTVVRDGQEVAERVDNEGFGRAYGAELMVRHKITERFFGWVAYTLMRSEFRNRPGDDFVITDYDQTHILTVVGSFRLGSGWELGGRFRLVTGNPYNPVIGASHDLDTDGWSRVQGPTHSARLPTFHQLDIRLDKTHTFQTWTLSWFIDLQNAYNRANAEDFFYDYRYRERVDFNGLPILPVLGVKGEW